jgi:hypothetical protein
MNHKEEHLSLLGFRVRDKVTGFYGVVTSISFDLYGCIQVVVNPGMDEHGKIGESHWFDVNRLEVKSSAPVMSVPDFVSGPVAKGERGPAEKPFSGKV